MDDRVIDRMESEARAFKRITNNDLVCKDCLYKLDDSKILGNTSFCNQIAARFFGGFGDSFDGADLVLCVAEGRSKLLWHRQKT